MIATIAIITLDVSRSGTMVNSIEIVAPVLCNAGTESKSPSLYRLFPVAIVPRYPCQCRTRKRSGMMRSSD
jgi:hypothetical protein